MKNKKQKLGKNCKKNQNKKKYKVNNKKNLKVTQWLTINHPLDKVQGYIENMFRIF